jgi:hypothetical protein
MPEGKKPESWLEAFYMLEVLLEKKDNGNRQVVFLDDIVSHTGLAKAITIKS